MFFSQCLVSKKGTLKSIWVAAYCHKKLKKEQVSETDISASVDEIILNEVSVTYRVLGYLLLGVVRIYSKKVEYLYEDSTEALTRINTYVPPRKDVRLKETLRAPYHLITLPDRFELDAFDLGISEDLSGEGMNTHHQIPCEETQVDARNERFSAAESYHHEEEIACFETNSSFHEPVHSGLSPYRMDIDMVVNLSHTSTIFETSMERFQDDHLSQEEYPDLEKFYWTEESLDLGAQLDEASIQNDQRKLVRSIERFQNDQLGTEEENPDVEINSQKEKVLDLGAQSHEIYSQNKQMKLVEVTPPSMERFQDDELPQEEHPNVEMNCGMEDPLNFGAEGDEVHCQNKKIKFVISTPTDPGNSHLSYEGHPLDHTANGTLEESKFPRSSGVTSPAFVDIETPASEERPRFSKKRKILFDQSIVLSNDVVRQSLHDSSSLVVKRRKGPQTALDVWKACRFPNLLQDFSKPLIPCTSQLTNLFCGEKLTARCPVKDVEGCTRSAGKRFEMPVEDAEGHTKCAKERYEIPVEDAEGKTKSAEERFEIPVEDTECRSKSAEERSEMPAEDAEGQNKSAEDKLETPSKSSQQEAFLANDTSDHSASVKFVESPTTSKSDKVGPTTPVAIDRNQMLTFETPDIHLNLMDEEGCPQEINSCKEGGLSVRTRKVARYLCESFLKKDRRQKDVLSLEQALEGKTRKESARVFYEILVLKSQEFVDVKQEAPFRDVLVLGTPQLKVVF